MQVHRVIADQMYHHYLGDPVETLLLFPDGTGTVARLGPDLLEGMRPQLLIPGGTYHISRLMSGGTWALLGTTEWGGVEAAELEIGNVEALVKTYPNFAEQITVFTNAST
jgi:predicted cupin superfamily sugar epimerase